MSEVLVVATAFIQWSANESGLGLNPASIAENNDFGQQDPPNRPGWWNGTAIKCARGVGPIAANSTNACFAAGLSWQSELEAVLATRSGKTGITYGKALMNSLLNNPTEGAAAILQSIADNGYNTNHAYGTTIANGAMGTQIQSGIQCLLRIGAIH